MKSHRHPVFYHLFSEFVLHIATAILVGTFIFAAAIGITTYRFSTQNRLATAVIAVLMPVLALLAFLRVLFTSVKLEPCPAGLEEAELVVEHQRQKMFGGEIRQPTFARNWQKAYDRELQRETDRVRAFTSRYHLLHTS